MYPSSLNVELYVLIQCVFSGASGTILDIDGSTLPSLVLIRFVDSEKSQVQDWWLPCEVLRVPTGFSHPPSRHIADATDEFTVFREVNRQAIEYHSRRALQSVAQVLHGVLSKQPEAAPGLQITEELRLELLQACAVHGLGRREANDMLLHDSVIALPNVVSLFDDVEELFSSMISRTMELVERGAHVLTLTKSTPPTPTSAHIEGASMLSLAVFKDQVRSISTNSAAQEQPPCMIIYANGKSTQVLRTLPLCMETVPICVEHTRVRLEVCGDSINEVDVVVAPVSWHVRYVLLPETMYLQDLMPPPFFSF